MATHSSTTHDTQNFTTPANGVTSAVGFGLTKTQLLGAFTVTMAVTVHLLHKQYLEKRARQNALPSRLMHLYAMQSNYLYASG
jgi:hypothetical protein